jgi:hypothetical protein
MNPEGVSYIWKKNHVICFDTVSERQTVNTPPSGFDIQRHDKKSVFLGDLRGSKTHLRLCVLARIGEEIITRPKDDRFGLAW